MLFVVLSRPQLATIFTKWKTLSQPQPMMPTVSVPV